MSREKIITTSAGIQIYTESFGDQTHPAILLISGAMASARKSESTGI